MIKKILFPVIICVVFIMLLIGIICQKTYIESESKEVHICKLLSISSIYYVDNFAQFDVNEPYELLSVDDLINGGVLSEDNPLSKPDKEKYYVGYLFDKAENTVYQFVVGPQNANCSIDFKRFANDFDSMTFSEKLEKLKKYYLDAQNLDYIMVGKRERPEKKKK